MQVFGSKTKSGGNISTSKDKTTVNFTTRPRTEQLGEVSARLHTLHWAWRINGPVGKQSTGRQLGVWDEEGWTSVCLDS